MGSQHRSQRSMLPSLRSSQLPAWLAAQLNPAPEAEDDESATAATPSPSLAPSPQQQPQPQPRPLRSLTALPAPRLQPSSAFRPAPLPRISLLGTDAGPVPQGALRLAAALRAEHPDAVGGAAAAGGSGAGGGSGGVEALQARIEALVLGLVRDVAEGRGPSLPVPTYRWRALRRHAPRGAADGEGEGGGGGAGAAGGAQRSVMSWGDTRARPRLAALLLVVARAARLLREDAFITRRELFYAHAQDLRDQSAIDVAVLDAAAVLEVPPWELRILPTSKGLIAGPMVLHMASGATIDCDVPGGALVPSDAHALVGARTAALFLLVVEKDAAFQRLLQEGVTRRVGPCVLVTGKGYPDTLVRVLLNRMWELLRLPVLLLMDADPHGIEIMATYRWGSKALEHESARLALPAARWLGVWPSEVAALGLRSRPLGPRDAARLRSLAARPQLRACPAVLREVECQMRIGVKAEIEDTAVQSSAFLTDMYIPRKLASMDVI